MSVERRTLLKTTAGAAVGGPFAGLVAMPAGAHHAPNPAALVPLPDQRDGEVRLHLPKGFRYRSFHDTESPVTLTDGTALPGRHDGMAAFDGPRRSVLLVRNHEVNNPGAPFGPGTPYDSMAQGGTTTIQVTPTGRVIRAFTSLNGTMMNCSGGPMPWGSWVTCEETVNGPDVGADFTTTPNTPLQKPHGYVFEVPVSHLPGRGQSDRKPITHAGRFAHEAVSFDPRRGHLYLTEDNFAFPSGFYRYEPPRHKHGSRHRGGLVDGGRLFALAVKDHPNIDLSQRLGAGTRFRVHWVEIDEPYTTHPMAGGLPTVINDDAIKHVGSQGWAKGSAFFSRLEGCTYDHGTVYFCSTQGGGDPEDPDISTPRPTGYGKGFGQIWAYRIGARVLELVYESPGPDVLDFPDNVTVSKRDTLVLCEDSTDFNYLRLLSKQGVLRDFAVNQMEGRTGDEFAGATFSRSGDTLYVNIQASSGLSFAIWGPWHRLKV